MSVLDGIQPEWDALKESIYQLIEVNHELREKLAASPQCDTCEAMLDCDECLRANESAKERKRLDYENAKLRELATYALRHIVEVWCEGEGRDLYRGKPCEDCVDYGSSDCPKCMPRVFDVSGIEVD